MFINKISNTQNKIQLKQITALFLFLFLQASTEMCFAADPDFAGQYYEQAIMKYRAGDNEAAIIELKNAIQQKPDYLAAHILLAKVQLQKKT